MKIFVRMVSFLCLLSSCGISRERPLKHDSPTPVKQSKKKQHNTLTAIKMQEAKLLDIPLSVSAKPLSRYYHVDDIAIMLGYRDYTHSIQELVTFYTQEMERLGWCGTAAVCGYESMLQFSKPNRWCIVSIRSPSSGKYVEWVITIARKYECN